MFSARSNFDYKSKFRSQNRYYGTAIPITDPRPLTLWLTVAFFKLGRNRIGLVCDYVDAQVPMLVRMFEKRLKGYRAIGYELESGSGSGMGAAAIL